MEKERVKLAAIATGIYLLVCLIAGYQNGYASVIEDVLPVITLWVRSPADH